MNPMTIQVQKRFGTISISLPTDDARFLVLGLLDDHEFARFQVAKDICDSRRLRYPRTRRERRQRAQMLTKKHRRFGLAAITYVGGLIAALCADQNFETLGFQEEQRPKVRRWLDR